MRGLKARYNNFKNGLAFFTEVEGKIKTNFRNDFTLFRRICNFFIIKT